VTHINKVLITGSTGMVGRHLIKQLQPHYHLITPHRSDLDLENPAATQAFIRQHQPDAIIHLAAKVGGIAANVADPVGFYRDNEQINHHLIYAALAEKVPYLMNLGSSCMYPANREQLTEEDLLDGKLEPTNEGYALAKITATKLCRYISQQYGFQYKTIIPCNLYGPYDKFDAQRAHLIPAIIRKIHHAKLNESPKITIWGNGEARREFMHVDDLTNFITLALKKFDELPPWINVGLGTDHTVNEYYQTVADVLEYPAQFDHDLTKPAGMLRKRLNIDKARSLGWAPRISLQHGIQDTYEYYLQSNQEAFI
jgi:GDP-L-fucose synthase